MATHFDKKTVIAISATHREKSNTEAMLLATLRPLIELGFDVEILRLRQMKILPCDGCTHCTPQNGCHLEDDLTRLYPRIFEAQTWIIASPEYWWNVSGYCKLFLDRLNGFWTHRDRFFAGKTGAILTCGGQPLARTGYAEKALEIFFSRMRFNFVGSVRASAENELEILNQPDILSDCTHLGKKVAQTMENT